MILRHLFASFRQTPALTSGVLTHRRHISALYVTGDKANQTFVALTPYFDFQARLANEQRLRDNIRARKSIDSVGDIDELLQLWTVFRDVQQRKATLERQRIAISDTLKAASGKRKSTEPAAEPLSEDRLHKLKADGALLRDDLKRLKEHSYAMEDAFVHRFLALPNELHPRTPLGGQPTVLHELKAPVSGGKAAGHHLQSGGRLIEYHDPYRYYLLDEAAEFEQAVCEWFSDRLRIDAGFVRSSNPDFCRSLLGEAAAIDLDRELLCVSDDGMPLVDEIDLVNRMHLAGAGSLVGFLGYCAKLMPYRSALPLRLVAVGRQYRRCSVDASERGLYGVSQSSAVQCMQAADSQQQAERLFDETVALLAQAYRQFGRRMRIVQATAEQLRPAEAMRADVEIWSAARAEYVRVSEIAYYGDFISKRLLFSYRDSAKATDLEQPLFVHLVGATAVDSSRLLAVLLEQEDGGQFRVPEFLL